MTQPIGFAVYQSLGGDTMLKVGQRHVNAESALADARKRATVDRGVRYLADVGDGTLKAFRADIRTGRVRSSVVRRNAKAQAAPGQDKHIATAVTPGVKPVTPNYCAECHVSGDKWVHLRICLKCGHVGCCEDSQNQHARKHAQAHGESHTIIQSFEPGEAWSYCYTDRKQIDNIPSHGHHPDTPEYWAQTVFGQ